MRKPKPIHRTMLLVCEGNNTEPLYFKSIRNVIEQTQAWGANFNLVIIPKIHDEDTLGPAASPHKTSRRSRPVKNAEKRIDGDVEPEYTPLPIKYVREAQLELNDKSYEEAWAIFDHDSRADVHLKAAFELAKNADKGLVRIAFSSKAFEHWFLLHFEQNIANFVKSECRDGKVPLECGTGKHKDDCFGVSCIGGYLRKMGYLEISTKKAASCYPLLAPRLEQAFINAAWLRFYMDSTMPAGTPKYDMNPYTDVDELVKYLLNDSRAHKWARLGANVDIEGVSIVLSRSGSTLYLENIGAAMIIIGANASLLNGKFERVVLFDKAEVRPSGQLTIDLSIHSNPEYFAIQLNRTNLFVKL